MPKNTSLLINHCAGICTLTLNKPATHNAFDQSLIQALTIALQQAKQDPAVQVVVLTANGSTFSAGADLNWMAQMANYSYEQNIQDAHQLANLLDCLYTLPKPTLALVQGSAFGGALGLIACCDIALASPEAYFCFSEVKLGLVPATISPYIIQAIGARQARRYFLTAEPFDAQQAQHLGLIHQIVTEQTLEATASLLCQQLQANCAAALTQVKQLLVTLAKRPLDKSLIEYTCDALAQARLRPTTQQKLKDFLIKKTIK